MLMIDAHQDLAYNMLRHARDYTQSAVETRQREANNLLDKVREDTLLGWPEYQRGQVGIIFATLFASPARLSTDPLDHLCYSDIQQANYLYRQQLELYQRLVDEKPGYFQLIQTRSELGQVLKGWKEPGRQDSTHQPAVGLVILMEGAEGVRAVGELEEWWHDGVRIIGPAWAGNRFCGGTHEPGDLTREGLELLEHMAGYGFGMDLSHMDEQAALRAADIYAGPILASHSNAKALLKGSQSNRHLSDHLIQAIVERDGVIGILPYNGFLKAGWAQGDRRELVTLQDIIAHIDYICQLAGDAFHVGIGSDFDGGFGLQSVPAEIDTIADLQKIAPLLTQRGYTEADISAIFNTNWLRILDKILAI